MSPREPGEDLQFLEGALLDKGRELASSLAATAVQRDRAGGTALVERGLLRQSGLLAASIALDLGGAGAGWPEILDLVRLFSRVDSSLGHLFGFHHLLLATAQLFGTREQWEPLHRETVERRWFWGNALNPLDPSTRLTVSSGGPLAGKLVLNGTKSFSSGSVDAELLIVSAIDERTNKLVVLTVAGDRTGLRAVGDWDNLGQRQTDSGTVVFSDVVVDEREILAQPGPLGSPRASLRPLLAQAVLVNVYLGLAEGALSEARSYTLSARRAWASSGVETPTQDPYVLRRYGELLVELEAARALADRAAIVLAQSLERGDSLTEEERGRTAVRVALAKVKASEVSLRVTSEVFEVMGARATTARLGLDRFWRNARTHTLHDPVDYKQRELGEFALLHELPRPTFYS